jgi:rare lipoprotein A
VIFKVRSFFLAPLVAFSMLIVTAEAKASSGEQAGVASWYGPGFHGRKTANGERFDMNALTAAHRTLPLGTQVRVTNTHTGQSVVVRINDRGPYVGRRVIDLSKASAQAIGLLGVAKVSIVRL